MIPSQKEFGRERICAKKGRIDKYKTKKLNIYGKTLRKSEQENEGERKKRGRMDEQRIATRRVRETEKKQ